MTGDTLAFGSTAYWQMAGLLLFGRGADFFSTWMATPTLALEGNPLAKKLGWKLASILNLALCAGLAFWPPTALAATTASLLVAAHNFQLAWLARCMGEEAIRTWIVGRMLESRIPIYLTCLLGETGATGLVGAGLMYWYREDTKAFAVGTGIVTYAFIVLFYTSFWFWRLRSKTI